MLLELIPFALDILTLFALLFQHYTSKNCPETKNNKKNSFKRPQKKLNFPLFRSFFLDKKNSRLTTLYIFFPRKLFFLCVSNFPQWKKFYFKWRVCMEKESCVGRNDVFLQQNSKVNCDVSVIAFSLY